MREAHRRARTRLRVRPAPGLEAWGWGGRTLGQAVTTPTGDAWLRLACTPLDRTDRTFWDGGATAEQELPRAIPRPRLRRWIDWPDETWTYRAELYDRVEGHLIAPAATLTTAPELGDEWWNSLRKAVDSIARIETERRTIHQHYIDAAMQHFLGVPLDTEVQSWKTAHGDLHWANLATPLEIIDWEGWGLAPTGYDVATLATHSLLIPSISERIRHEFADLLDSPAGRFAELVIITETLHSATWGSNLQLVEPISARAEAILGRPIPKLRPLRCRDR
ncbi:hypothetical protein AB0I61_33050 [Polymorphospora rubra]|uniref:hypothetical protein n=1 Tax=Polymorphospora rubra TaxID=338584 RepID=UPI0033CB5F78